MEGDLRKIAALIREGENFLVTSHIDPDGDSIASQLALSAAFLKLGKKATIVNCDPLPRRYLFLPNSHRVLIEIPQDLEYGIVIALDSANPDRLGEPLSTLLTDKTLLNIDHHASNLHFGDLNLVVSESSSSCEIVYDIIRTLGVEMDPEIATDLFTGICTDTGGFKHEATTARTFAVLSSLVEKGANASEIMNRLYEDNPPSKMKLLGSVLSSLEVVDGISVLTLTQKMLRATGSNMEESESFAEHTLSLRGVKVGMLFREMGDGVVRASLRSRKPIDVAGIASLFGGGGHRRAAGCQLRGRMEEVKEKLIRAVREAID